MLLQELSPDAPCLPEHTAKRIVEYGENRLQKSGVQAFISTSSSSSTTTSVLIKIDEISVSELLGQGSFSTVYQLANHKDRVVKVLKPKLLKKPALFAGCAADLVREGILLSHLSHPNLLTCYAMGTLAEFSNGRHDSCALLLERLDITLKDKLTEWRNKARIILSNPSMPTTPSVQDVLFVLSGTKHRRLRQTLLQRTDVLCQLADAIQFLHAHGIMHRDLKPDNIGFVGSTLKVFDLDVCRILPKEANHSDDLFQFTKHVGSPRYMAPEVARGERYNSKADIYAFGLLAFEVLSLQKAYHDIPSGMMDAKVFYQGARPCCPSQWPQAVTLLITNCWAESIEQRPTMSQVVEELRETLDRLCPIAVKKRQREQRRKQQQQESSDKRLAREDSRRTYRSDTSLEAGAAQ